MQVQGAGTLHGLTTPPIQNKNPRRTACRYFQGPASMPRAQGRASASTAPAFLLPPPALHAGIRPTSALPRALPMTPTMTPTMTHPMTPFMRSSWMQLDHP